MSSPAEQLKAMGFAEEAVLKALKEDPTMEGALEKLMAQATSNDTPMTDAEQSPPPEGAAAAEAATAEAPKVAMSIKCIDTGKLFRTMDDAMLYAERTGHSNFEESSEEVARLTPEEKKARVEALRQQIMKKRAQREANEAVDARLAEIARRKDGQAAAQTREALEKASREREWQKRKKEKADFKAHKERLRIEVAKDKAERAADKVRRQGGDTAACKAAYDASYDKSMGGGGSESSAAGASATPGGAVGLGRMDSSIKKLQNYKAGGDGERALTVLGKLVGNVLKAPEEPKYRRVNLDNATIKKRLTSLVGGAEFLKACGWVKVEDADGRALLLNDPVDVELLKSAKAKIEAALESS